VPARLAEPPARYRTPAGSVAFCYAARLSSRVGAVAEFGSVNPANAARGLPSVAAVGGTPDRRRTRTRCRDGAGRTRATAREAVAGAHIVALCTLGAEPVLNASWLTPGSTVISIGSIEPDRHEVGTGVVAEAARVVVDDPGTAAAHAGPIVEAIRAGTLTYDEVIGLGDVLTGRRTGAPASVGLRLSFTRM
jgi:ornithine cyclodeaminase/alanine dehydrogenase-like protein (mu-crystallin family)